jgi:hypothetical protein
MLEGCSGYRAGKEPLSSRAMIILSLLIVFPGYVGFATTLFHPHRREGRLPSA